MDTHRQGAISAFQRMVIALVRGYQRFISPLLPPSCRYQPTCSEYMVVCVKRFGVSRGTLLGVQRILRCNPWGSHGHDPVPEKE